MIELSCETAVWVLVFPVLQAVMAGALLALLLWCEQRMRARRRGQGDGQ